jgi:hypothetical protein
MNAITSFSEFDEKYAALLKRMPDSVQGELQRHRRGLP